MLGNPNSPELFPILVAYYTITNDTEKNYRKEIEFNESLTSAQWMKLLLEYDISLCSSAR